MNANFDSIPSDDHASINALAPLLNSYTGIKDGWGLMNIAQCAQDNGDADGCWSYEYFCDALHGQTGISYFNQEEQAEILAVWRAAGGTV